MAKFANFIPKSLRSFTFQGTMNGGQTKVDVSFAKKRYQSKIQSFVLGCTITLYSFRIPLKENKIHTSVHHVFMRMLVKNTLYRSTTGQSTRLTT